MWVHWLMDCGEVADQVGAIRGDDWGVIGALLPATIAHYEHL